MRLTATEQEHARRSVYPSPLSRIHPKNTKRHADLTDDHFYSSVLQSLPVPQRGLDEEPAFVPPISAYSDAAFLVCTSGSHWFSNM